MNSLAKHLGTNHWIMLIEFLVLLASRLYRSAWPGPRGIEYTVVRIFFSYSVIAFILSHQLIFHSEGIRTMANPPLREGWKRPFFLLYTPHLVYCLWCGGFMALGGAPLGLLFTAAMAVSLLCAWLRLSMEDG